MPRYDFRTPRLFVDSAGAAQGDALALTREQANYLAQCPAAQGRATRCSCSTGATANGARALPLRARRRCGWRSTERVREQTAPGDLHYLFAPLKHARLDYMVQKAVEMGVSRLQPVFTRHTQAERVNLARMRRERHRGRRAMRHS